MKNTPPKKTPDADHATGVMRVVEEVRYDVSDDGVNKRFCNLQGVH